MTRLLATLLSLVALVTAGSLSACGSPQKASDVRTESKNGQCVVSTGKAAGDACDSPNDCAMGCCQCDGTTKHFSASACEQHVCLSVADACATAKTDVPTACD